MSSKDATKKKKEAPAKEKGKEKVKEKKTSKKKEEKKSESAKKKKSESTKPPTKDKKSDKKSASPPKAKKEKVAATGNGSAPSSSSSSSSVVRDTVDVPKELHFLIVGSGGETIKALKSKTGAEIVVPREESNTLIEISGPTKEVVAKAKKEVEKIRDKAISDRKKRDDKQVAESDKLYSKGNKAVEEHAKLREKYYKESKEAYERGDKALAKELSEKGKKEGELMEKAKLKAAEQTFKAKNKSNDPGTIDLHGQLVDPAVQLVEKHFQTLAKKHPNIKELNIITGAGNHSQDKAKIKPAIETYLKEHNYTYKESNNGTFTVTLP
ncbi:Golgi phosphoprotein 3 GPP34 [Balamuthia mandrillaris]